MAEVPGPATLPPRRERSAERTVDRGIGPFLVITQLGSIVHDLAAVLPHDLLAARVDGIRGRTSLAGAHLARWLAGPFLPFLAVGLYGEALPNPNGAPIRLVVPWKYGFKGIKSIVRISFVEKQPPSSWNIAQPWEYGFYANVNPEVDHPRWSQARERRIGSGRFASKQTTLMFNGYGEHVAHLYKGLDLRKNY